MIARQRRASFLSVEEFLGEAIEQSRNAERALRSCLHKVKEPYSLGIGEAADIEQEVAALLTRFTRNGPENVLRTQVQYTFDNHETREPDDPFQALEYLIGVNKQIGDDLGEMARKAAPDSVKSVLEILERNVATLARKISMIHVAMQHD